MTTVRATVVQEAPVAFDRERMLEKLRALAAQAAERGAQLVVFPEAFVADYPRGLDFGARVGSRTAAGRELFRRYWDSAVDVPGRPPTPSAPPPGRSTPTWLSVSSSATAAPSTARSCSSPSTGCCWASTAS